MAYLGPDRRVHTVFMTRHREYHTRSGICVAVRDRRTGVWLADHDAIGMHLERFRERQLFLGRPLVFHSCTRGVETSAVMDIARPGRTTVEAYTLVSGLSPLATPPVFA